jgi:hypothetical protein
VVGLCRSPSDLLLPWRSWFLLIGCTWLDCIVRSACVGRDVDTSMFLRTVASPETLNG